ncbi:MAG: hypothetical protein AUI91_15420 [Acidobacteria bacterium 13_1_40CM_3_56_11]|nr:MAG: hypothetical protein AUI91_15420 [Acidobacteria bacterium 13_1_40CM_3_56_11]
MIKIETAEKSSRIVPVYFDSALIAKFYLNEPGREAIRSLARDAGSKLREGSVDRDVFDALQGQFQHDLTNGLWRLIGPTEVLLQQVRTLFLRLDSSVFLRSLDALHLITAKAEHFNRIYSNDQHLLSACPSVDLEGINPIRQRRPEAVPSDPSRRSAVQIPKKRRAYRKLKENKR